MSVPVGFANAKAAAEDGWHVAGDGCDVVGGGMEGMLDPVQGLGYGSSRPLHWLIHRGTDGAAAGKVGGNGAVDPS